VGCGRPAVTKNKYFEKVVNENTIEAPCNGIAQWSSRLMAERFGFSHSIVQSI
jgi:hypothetical protein